MESTKVEDQIKSLIDVMSNRIQQLEKENDDLRCELLVARLVSVPNITPVKEPQKQCVPTKSDPVENPWNRAQWNPNGPTRALTDEDRCELVFSVGKLAGKRCVMKHERTWITNSRLYNVCYGCFKLQAANKLRKLNNTTYSETNIPVCD